MKTVLQIVLLVLLLVAAGFIVSDRRSIAALRAENQQLRDALDAQAAAGQSTTAATQAVEDELARLRADASQLPRLRGELTRLRAITNEMAGSQQEQQRLAAENERLRVAANDAAAAGTTPADVAPPDYMPRENWAFAGYATADASLTSMLWGMQQGDINVFLNALSTEAQEELRKRWEKDNKTEAQIAAEMQRDAQRMSGFHLTQVEPQSDGSMALSVTMDMTRDDGTRRTKQEKMIFRQVGNEWKFSPK